GTPTKKTTQKLFGRTAEALTPKGHYARWQTEKPGWLEITFRPENMEYEIASYELIEFSYDPSKDERLPIGLQVYQVDLVASFNHWLGEREHMKRCQDGVYRAWVPLVEGKHSYQFKVNKEYTISDPNRKGGKKKTHFNVEYNEQAIHAGFWHDPAHPLAFEAISATDSVIRARLETKQSLSFFWKINEQGELREELMLPKGDGLYELTIQYPKLSPQDQIHYFFKIGESNSIYIAKSKSKYPPKSCNTIKPRCSLNVPEWSRTASWYLIMPDRFRNAQTSNDPHWIGPMNNKFKNKKKVKVLKWTSDWEGRSPWEVNNDRRFGSRMYGGDLQGIASQFDYLKSIGINSIWMNPIFEAHGHHKYGTLDYKHIDDNLSMVGQAKDTEELNPDKWEWTQGDKYFLDFLKQAHKKGIRIVLDGVFNHTGSEHWAFEKALIEGPESKFAQWFHFEDWSDWQKNASLEKNKKAVKYMGFMGYKSMPKLNLKNPEVRQHFMNITKRWLDPDGNPSTRDGIDGWRLDVAGAVPDHFWREWKQIVMTANPEAYVVGEIWKANHHKTRGDIFDALMNYPILMKTLDFFIPNEGGISSSELVGIVKEMQSHYPKQTRQILMNLCGTHDTDRFISKFVNQEQYRNYQSDLEDGYVNKNPVNIDPSSIQKAALFYTFLYTMEGAPLIYYGDEVGLYGANDPHCRRPMLWDDLEYDNGDKANRELRQTITTLNSLRTKHKCLPFGDTRFITLPSHPKVLAYVRCLGEERLLILINRANKKCNITLSQTQVFRKNLIKALDLITGASLEANQELFKVELEGISSRILRLQ
ncbi:MAG: alpha-glucosidase C-terminal domain-containing protein, partial [Planctomycetes bacterium]|nr:alpha-glucosidase C-terminal domain-containing protein [Planctomycetota bacterium]